jgi:hypothetical protein
VQFEIVADDNPGKSSNEEYLGYLLNYSNAGPLRSLIFVMALESYLDAVLSRDAVNVPQSLINVQAYKQACKILKDEFDAKYNPTSKPGNAAPRGQ